MLGSITPLGERSRGMRWGVTVTAFAAGAVIGGALAGAVAGAAGDVLLGSLDGTQALAVLAGACLLGLAADLRLFGTHLPTVRRQVDERWLRTYRGWVYGAGFGFQLGLGVVTVVTASAVYLTFADAALTGSVAAGAALGAFFGATRAAAVLPGGRVRAPGQVVAVDRVLRRWERPARRAGLAITLAVAAAAVVLAAS